MTPPPPMVYQFLITLLDIKPTIWRRILIPTTSTFWDLHSAVQDVFLWNGSHPHQFHFEDMLLKKTLVIGLSTNNRMMYNDENFLSSEHKVSNFLNSNNPFFKYIYDLDYMWMHLIELEAILPAEKLLTYPLCIGGKRNSPPEDCGGVSGYESILNVFSNSLCNGNDENEDSIVWQESIKEVVFDPEFFEPTSVRFMNPKQRYKEYCKLHTVNSEIRCAG